MSGVNYDYDLNGNLTDVNNGQFEYYYDCENRLTRAGSPFNTFKYDYRGRMVKGKYNTNNLEFTYDGDQIIAEYSGALLGKYIYGPGIDEPICRIHVSGETETMFYYHFDGLGSVVALSDNSGNVVEKYSYDVYGKPTIRDPQDAVRSTSACYNRYMFTGREYDTETGLYYYRARFYNPAIGRFMQVDPIRHGDRLSVYTYAKNNPVMLIDPDGMKPWYGKYCGPGNIKDEPDDDLDAACKEHDECYGDWGDEVEPEDV